MKIKPVRKEQLVFREPPFRIVHAQTLRDAFFKSGIGHGDFWKIIMKAKHLEQINVFGNTHDERIMVYFYDEKMKKFLSDNKVKYEP